MMRVSTRGRRILLFGVLGAILVAVGLEVYGRWVARNLGIIAGAAVETPGQLNTTMTDAPPYSVVVSSEGDTVAEITALTRPPGGEVTGYLGILTDSLASAQLLDTMLVGVLAQETPVVIKMRSRSQAGMDTSRRLWIVNLPRFIPVFRAPGDSVAATAQPSSHAGFTDTRSKIAPLR